MPNKLWSTTTDKTRMIEKPPFGPGFSIEQVELAESMVITFTDFKDAGEDYTIFELFDKAGKSIAVTKIEGY
jgi:hypothetical protein